MSPQRRMTPQVAEERPAARLTRPLREFMETEVAGGAVLLAAVVIAIVWANSPWAQAYDALWQAEVSIAVVGRELTQDLRHWVNDGLMVVFFFVVGLEIKRELAVGEMSTFRRAALPAMAALGGMIVPAALFLALNPGGQAARGWGIPMATDIAFALGALALLGSGLPQTLRVLLLSLAIVDDVGAILVIAIFYSGGVEWGWLATALGLLGVVVAARSLRVWWVPIYVVIGTGVWFATLQSGVHATIAGVALGLLAPARPLSTEELRRSLLPQREERNDAEEMSAEEARLHGVRVQVSVPVTDRLEQALHPWTSYVVLPVFALANAGVPLSLADLGNAATSMLTLGIVVGLVAGKTVGISAFSWLSVRFGADLPEGIGWRHVVGLGALAGIGFTMSLFIGGLAFQDPRMANEAKAGILAGSLLAASLGAIILRSSSSDRG
ncbi:MAG TPA: Na+/H+ antiporter NhaA [Actinomycetota bacterium]|nr:Na+/H+ antiporter NhaA [Actinomycetota bacterium]